MYQDVDVIGSDQVVKLIQQSKLHKFMIYRKGSGKGSIPVFECTLSQNTNQACKAFQDWANSALSMNPHNILPYEILLYSKNATDQDLENDARFEMNAPKDELNASRRRENKIKFSFALNGVHGGQFPGYPVNNSGGGVNVQDEIKRALDHYKMEQEIKELKQALKDRDDDDDDDGDDGSALMRVSNLLKEIRLSGGNKKGTAIAGDDDDDFEDLDDDDDDEDLDDDDDDDSDDKSNSDDDDDDDSDDDDSDDDDEEETERRSARRSPKSKNSKQAKILAQRKRLKTALRILMKKDKKLIPHLEKLAKLSKQNPMMFKTVLTNLDALKL